jgi:hypothetical protein
MTASVSENWVTPQFLQFRTSCSPLRKSLGHPPVLDKPICKDPLLHVFGASVDRKPQKAVGQRCLRPHTALVNDKPQLFGHLPLCHDLNKIRRPNPWPLTHGHSAGALANSFGWKPKTCPVAALGTRNNSTTIPSAAGSLPSEHFMVR